MGHVLTHMSWIDDMTLNSGKVARGSLLGWLDLGRGSCPKRSPGYPANTEFTVLETKEVMKNDKR